MIIAVDFDGTITENGHWPDVGPAIPGAIQALNYLHWMGHKIIVNSCRAGDAEAKMKEWILENKIPVDAINENLIERSDKFGGDCRKISADIYIDDKNVFSRGIFLAEHSPRDRFVGRDKTS